MSLKRFFRRARWDDERARELEAHLAIEIDDHIARGMSPQDARLAARRKLGSPARIREEIYDFNTVPIVETARLDLRDAVRQLRRRPLVTGLAFLLLTIGVGASAAAFSVAYGVLVRPLPYPDADRLAVLWADVRGERGQIAHPDYQDIRAAVPFEAAAVFGSGRVTLSGGVDADRVNLILTEPVLLRLLGARAVVGRLLAETDDGHDAIAISRRLWQAAFQSDPHIVGRQVDVSGAAYSIVGVIADLDFELPVGGNAAGAGFTIKDVDLWTPFNLAPGIPPNRAVSTYEAIVKLPAGQSLAGAQRALDVVAANLSRAYPTTNGHRGFRLVPLGAEIVASKSPAILIASAGALLILLVACANLASLFLGDLPERRHDFALREALGASRGRLMRQIALESALLSAGGATAGLLLARVVVDALKAAANLPRLAAIRFDLPVTLSVAAVALAAGFVARLAPMWRMRHAADDLRASVSAYATSAPVLRRGLVAVQLALAVVLSAAAVLLGLSLRAVVRVDPGFATSHVLSARVSAYRTRHPDQAAVTRFVNDLVRRLAAFPGVEIAAASSSVPLTGSSFGTAVAVEDRLLPIAERPAAGWQTITPGYFSALGIRIVSGRDFEPADLEPRAHRTIINQALARRVFGDASPIGRRLFFGADEHPTDWHEVVGVVADVRHGALVDAAAPRAYDLLGQHGGWTVYLVARASIDPYALAPAIRATVAQVDREAPVFDVRSLDDIVDGTIAPRRLATGFAGGIAGVSVLLAAIGLYGLLASSVAARTRELGIRRALGSSTSAIVRLVFSEAAWLAVAGCVVGAAASVAAGTVIQSQLFAVQATDGRVIAAVAAILVIIGAVAAYVPARRAARVDPAVALRAE